MRTSSKAGLAAAVIAAAAAAALAQERPESILPPGFGDAAPTPAPTARPAAPGRVPQPAPGTTPSPAATGFIQPLPSDTPSATPTATPSATPSPIDPATLARYEMPAFARRSLNSGGISRRKWDLPRSPARTEDLSRR